MWTRHEGACPPAPGPARCRTLVAKGLYYERRVFRQLRQTDLPLEVQPWLSNASILCQPDAVALPGPRVGIVIEVKLNWKQRRDRKLRTLYLPAVAEAFDLTHTFPLMIVSCLRGAVPGRPILRDFRSAFRSSLQWRAGAPVPILLLP